MNIESAREYCLSLPHSTENVQWGADLCMKIAGKLFAVMSLEPGSHVLSFKCTPEKFYELQEIEGIVPAPYMARAQWVALHHWDVLRDDELRDLLRTSHELVFARLTRKQQNDLNSGNRVSTSGRKKKSAKKNVSGSAKSAAKTSAKKAAKKTVRRTKR